MKEVITFGESMVLFNPGEKGPLRHIHGFSKSIAGAESNVAIALARLGHEVGWFSKVGDDEFGRYITFMVRGEGIDVSRVITDKEHPTGLLFKELFEHVNPNVYYYRKHSAASFLKVEDLDAAYIQSAKILHITGITPAISEVAREAVFAAVEIAKKAGVIISFDPNIRLKLWSREEAKETLLKLCAKADILFPGIDEGKILLGTNNIEDILSQFHGMGVKTIALKLGKEGCIVSSKDEELTSKGSSFEDSIHESHRISGYVVDQFEDSVGAGDGFAAGFLSSYLKGLPLKECGDFANGR